MYTLTWPGCAAWAATQALGIMLSVATDAGKLIFGPHYRE